MKNLAIALAMLCIVVIAGCDKILPKPNNAQTAGVEALVAYGLAAHTAGQYLALPLCTSPITVAPCKTQAIADRIKAADIVAYNAANAADKAVNDPTANAAAAASLATLKAANAEAKH